MVALTVPVGEAKPGETAPRRKTSLKAGALERPEDSKATTVTEFFEECADRFSHHRAMGWRKYVETFTDVKMVTKIENGEERQVEKAWNFYEYSPYEFITYAELKELVRSYGRGLVEFGLRPLEDKLHIYALTSPKWMQTFLAAQSQGIPAVTAYDTLGEAGLIHSLLETELAGIFTDNTLLGTLVRPLQKAKSVKFIIHFDELDPEDKRNKGKYYGDAKAAIDKILEVRPDIKFISYEKCIKLGEKSQVSLKKTKPEDLACIMYTSGSTGPPKGVVISQENIVAAVGGISTNAGRDVVREGDRVIAFLPLAHIFEMVFEFTCLWWGGTLGYANVKTLTDASCRNCKSDMEEFKPHIMVGVAAVWESVRKGVMAKVKRESALVQKIFWGAYRAKSTMSSYKIPGAGAFDIIFKKVKAATGGHLRMVLNGGSPISKDAQAFVSILIAPMLIGYGLTETCANATVVEMEHLQYGVQGTLTGAVTSKLVDVPEAGYFAKNNQGEVLVKGKCVTKEYYKNEKETAEAFTPDGWFKTGDIGEWTSNGALRIIDRKKNLVKTLNGEYIALEKLESVYRSNSLAQNICVYADQSRVKPVAIVLPIEAHLRTLLRDEKVYSEEQLEQASFSHLCEDKKVAKVVLKQLLQTGKAQGLVGIELLQNVILLDDEWTPQNGFVTSAQKLQRRKILDSCKKKVEEAYNNS